MRIELYQFASQTNHTKKGHIMEELRGQLKSFIDEATVELVRYPLQEWRNWGNMTEEEAAHILFLHSSFMYARGFYELLKTEDKEEKTLLLFCRFLSEFGCKPAGIQYETFFIHMMNNPESVFSKYKWDIDRLYEKERQEHHWSIGDMTGGFLRYKRKVLPDNLGISEEKVFHFIICKCQLLPLFRNYLSDESYVNLFYSCKYDQVLLRRPLWVKCVDQQQFIESFSRKHPNVNKTVWSMDNLTPNQQIPENGVLFFIIPNDVPDNKIDLVLNLLKESQDLISKYTLLVILDKQVIKHGTKIHYHEFLNAIDDRIFPCFQNQELHNAIYGEYKVDETGFFDYFWVDE